MHVTFEVSKRERSNEVKEEHRKNILLISVTCEVSKLERFSAVREEQPENRLFIFVTLEVSKREISNEIKEEHRKNILLISVTCEVLRCSSPSILLSDASQENHTAVVAGRNLRNEVSNTAVRMVVLGDSLVPTQAGIRMLLNVFFSSIPHVVPSRSTRRVS